MVDRSLWLAVVLGFWATACSSSPTAGWRDAAGHPDDATAGDGAATDGGATPDALALDGASPGDAGPDAAAAHARDWTSAPPIVEVDTAADVYALGDVHGDYQRMVGLLVGAGLVGAPAQPTDAQWLAGTATLVCTGDLIDKWVQALDVIAYLAALRTAAAGAGGRVIVTMGNHEAAFLADPTNPKVVDFVGELQAAGLVPAEVAAGHGPVGTFLRDLPFAARVNDWFFVHAGNTGGENLTQLETDMVAGVDAAGFGAPVLAASTSLLESDAPWWELSGLAPEAVLVSYGTALGVQHIVQGHRPGKIQFSDGTVRPKGVMYQKFGRIFLIDVGMSQGVDDSTGALLHLHGTGPSSASIIYPDGTTDPLW
jgi:hypothetical protein